MKRYISHVILSLALIFSLLAKGGEDGGFSSLIKREHGFVEKESIHLSVRVLTKEEGKKYLFTDVESFGYFPVQITIENDTQDGYFISSESIGLDISSGEEVVNKILRKAIPRSILLKIAGFLFWPLSIVDTFHSCISIKMGNELKKSLLAKSVQQECILPYSVVNRVFFVEKENFQNTYTISLQNKENLSVRVFSIEMIQKEDLQSIDPLPLIEENYYLTHEYVKQH